MDGITSRWNSDLTEGQTSQARVTKRRFSGCPSEAMLSVCTLYAPQMLDAMAAETCNEAKEGSEGSMMRLWMVVVVTITTVLVLEHGGIGDAA